MDVMTGGVIKALTVIEKFVGPTLPTEFVMVTAIVLVPFTVGVPLSNPPTESVNPVGTPVAL